MGRIATSRVPDIRGVWIWPWLPGIGIPYVQVFPPAQEWKKKESEESRCPVTFTPLLQQSVFNKGNNIIQWGREKFLTKWISIWKKQKQTPNL